MVEKPLSNMKPGEKGIISKVAGDASTRKRLLEMGFVKGTEVIAVRKAPLGDPIEFLLKGYNITLRKIDCENVYVVTESEEVVANPTWDVARK
jgi:Fe2+ transport system protein FeoA